MSAAINMIATCESLALGKALGMDVKVLVDIMSHSTGKCWTIDTYSPAPGVFDNCPSSKGYVGGMSSEMMLKDVNLVLETADSVNFKTGMGQCSK
jgi:3-hydroxyisobutyrate dehydrogenase